mmetsp:Transcript_2885/g.7303  ORF Transcript_2885/g.7303 Transcript_2885/m.7303 type:complete len:107 (-) Transcript_2885:71-391(-)
MALRVSRVACGIFESQFYTPGPGKRAKGRSGLLWVWGVFAAPTFLVLMGNHPAVQAWFVRLWRPMEFPPQADPSIVSDIYHGRKPRASSMDSYNRETNIVMHRLQS